MRVGITFPSHYPNGAAPFFTFDNSTTIDFSSQQELNRVCPGGGEGGGGGGGGQTDEWMDGWREGGRGGGGGGGGEGEGGGGGGGLCVRETEVEEKKRCVREEMCT